MKVRDVIKILERHTQQHFETIWSEAISGRRAVKYAIVIEEGKNSYGAYVPDLPVCVAVAETKEEVLELIREAVELHLESMRQGGLSIPEPKSTIEYVQV